MNRQTKKEIRRLAVKILVAVLALGLAFWGYAFVYRGKTEPPAKYPVTNQDAAVYSLRGQIQMLSQQEELNTFAFEGRKKEKEYGTYIIPGLRYTRTFLNAEGTKQAVCTSMTPQGLAVTDEYVLVSAYCHTEKHNSVIYVINKETHRFIKEVVLPGLPHVGGLARLLHMTIAECQRDPAGSAGRAAEKYQACCVRKDSVTVTAEEGREQYYINTSGSSALATAGSGDVLAGITGAFAAKRQCEKNEKKISLAKTAALAAYAHGKAGEAAEEKSSASYVTASEIIRGLQSI